MSLRAKLASKLEKAEGLLEKVDQVTSLLVATQTLRGPALVGLGVRATQMLVEHLRPVLNKHVSWPVLPSTLDISMFLLDLLAPLEVQPDVFGYVPINYWKFFQLDGKGVAIYCENEWHIRVHLQETQLGHFWNVVNELAWQRTGSRMALTERGKGFSVSPCSSKPPLPSPRSEEIWDRIKPFLCEGDARYLVLDGRPGTGKTVLAEELMRRAEILFGSPRTLHIPMSNLGINADTLLWAVQILRPQIAIINDFDRGFSSDLLDFLEKSRSFIRLLIVTVNNLNYLSSAMIRPGRFDEVFSIEGLGQTFVQDFLDDLWSRLSPESQGKVLKWPVAYLEELRLRGRRRPKAPLDPEVADLELRLAPREVPEWAERVLLHPTVAVTPARP